MQEQNFEKQVKQKMEELSVAPSAPVWMKVEEKIRQKRSKRRIIFWIFPLGILLAGGIVFSLTRFNNKPVAVEQHSVKQKNTNPINQPGLIEQPITARSNADNTQPSAPEPIQISGRGSLALSNNVTAAGKSIQKSLIDNAPLKTQKQKQKIQPSIDKPLQELPPAMVTNQNTKDEMSSAVSTTIAGTIRNDRSADSVANTAKPETVQLLPREEKPASQNKETAIILPGEKSKWQISPFVSFGLSSLQYAPGAREKNASQYSFSPTTPGIGSSVPPPSASSPEKGLSLQLGVKFMKPLNRRLNVTMGLAYYYASTHQKIGEVVAEDSVFRNNFTSPVRVNRYYRTGSTENYTNSYHFVEIPLGINWRVNKNIPLELQTGFTVAQLIAAKALTYDGYGNYYRNNKLLYHTHVTFNGSLSYRLLNIRQHAVYAGPYFKYHLTQLEKSNSGQFLFSAGMGISVKF